MKKETNSEKDEKSSKTTTTAKLGVENKKVSLRHVTQQQLPQQHQQTPKQNRHEGQKAGGAGALPVNLQQCQPNFCQTYGVCVPGPPLASNYGQAANTAGALGQPYNVNPIFCIRCHHYHHPTHASHCQQAAHGACQSFIQLCPYPPLMQAQGCTPMIATYMYQYGADQQPCYVGAITSTNSKSSLCSDSGSDKGESSTALGSNSRETSKGNNQSGQNPQLMQSGKGTRKIDETSSSIRYNEDKASVGGKGRNIADFGTKILQNILQPSDDTDEIKHSMRTDNDNNGSIDENHAVSNSPTPTVHNTSPALPTYQPAEPVAVIAPASAPSTSSKKPRLSKVRVVDLQVDNTSFNDAQDASLVSASPTDTYVIPESKELVSSTPIPAPIEKNHKKAVNDHDDNDIDVSVKRIESEVTKSINQTSKDYVEMSNSVKESKVRAKSDLSSSIRKHKELATLDENEIDMERFQKIKNERTGSLVQNNNDTQNISDSMHESEISTGNELPSPVGGQDELEKIAEMHVDESEFLQENQQNDLVQEDNTEESDGTGENEPFKTDAENDNREEFEGSHSLKGKLTDEKTGSHKGRINESNKETADNLSDLGRGSDVRSQTKSNGSKKTSIGGQNHRDSRESSGKATFQKSNPNILSSSGKAVGNSDTGSSPKTPSSSKDKHSQKKLKRNKVERKQELLERVSESEKSQDQETRTIGSMSITQEILNNSDNFDSTFTELPLEATDRDNSMHSHATDLQDDRTELGKVNHNFSISNSSRNAGSQKLNKKKKDNEASSTTQKSSRINIGSDGTMSRSPKASPDKVTDKEQSESVKDIFHEYFATRKFDDALDQIKNQFPGQNIGNFIQILSKQVASMSEVVEGEQQAGRLVRLLIGNGDIRKKAVIKEISSALEDLPKILEDSPMATFSVAQFLVEIFYEENISDWIFQVGDKFIRGNDANKSTIWGELSINTWRVLQLKNNEERI